MARIAGVDIPKNKRGVIALTYIFGIGRSRAVEILEKALKLSKLCQRKKSIPLGMFGNSFPRGFVNQAGFFGVWNPTEVDEWIELDIPIKLKVSDTVDYWTGEKIYSLEIDNTLKKIKVMLKPFQAIVIGFKN